MSEVAIDVFFLVLAVLGGAFNDTWRWRLAYVLLAVGTAAQLVIDVQRWLAS